MRTFIIADDHPATLAGIKHHIENLGYEVIGAYENGIMAYNNIINLKPNCVILDLSMPGMTGIEILQKIRDQSLKIKVIIYTMYREFSIYKTAHNLEVDGYLLKEFAIEEMQRCIEAIEQNKKWSSDKLHQTMLIDVEHGQNEKLLLLTPAEKKIISLIGEQKSSKEIADLLFISEKTVEGHRSNIIKKLDIPKAKNALLLWAMQNRI